MAFFVVDFQYQANYTDNRQISTFYKEQRMKYLFLTLWSLVEAVEKKLVPGGEWRKNTLFFILNVDKHVCLGESLKIGCLLEEAEQQGRLVWKPADNLAIQPQLSELLEKNGLEPLNHNLPPIVDPDFLKIAVERTNNKGVTRVTVFA